MMAIPSAEPSGSAGANPAGPASSRAPVGAELSCGGEEIPLLDAAVLHAMEEQLGLCDIARNFANDFAEMWGERQRCLVDSVGREDRVAALDAVISLKVSSAMVGGLRLARLAEALESTIREGDLHDGAPVLAMISIHGRATVKELQQGYLRKAG
jgi:hypothetical protein